MGNYGWFFERDRQMGKHTQQQQRTAQAGDGGGFDSNGAGRDRADWEKLLSAGDAYLNQGTTTPSGVHHGDIAMTWNARALKSLLTNIGDKFERGVAYFRHQHGRHRRRVPSVVARCGCGYKDQAGWIPHGILKYMSI
jgi:hypothetical protein